MKTSNTLPKEQRQYEPWATKTTTTTLRALTIVPILLLVLISSSILSCSAFLPVARNILPNYYHHSSALFGVTGFRSWFETQFPDSMAKIQPRDSRDTFDHVLLDMNHMIHVVMRRSRSEAHAIRLLMSELDAVLNMVVPTKSLVLAIDGAPPAAKLATQRSRRYGTLVKTQWKLDHFDKLRLSKRERTRKLHLLNNEIKSLQITPGTEFADLMERTLQYWAWQRMQHRHAKLADVRIFISPSSVPGEGEVKLLEWILQRPRNGESIAIFGGDSDLILEGFIIPPYWAYNIFVIQASSTKGYYSVSLWEATRQLQSWLPPSAPSEQVLQSRTDLVLLMMLNGNDYFPKLRGGRGFSHLCRVYRRLIRDSFQMGLKPEEVGLIDPDRLEYRLDFCIRFFEAIFKTSPPIDEDWAARVHENSNTPLARLNNIILSGYIPGPKKFTVMEDLDEEEVEKDVDGDEEEPHQVLVKLSLGEPESEDFTEYEVWWRDEEEPLKDAKHRLALMALDDFFDTDLAASGDDLESMMEESGITTKGYSWELPFAAPGRCDAYLGGLLWNIQTYQDGICADYNYSYGRRLSPSLGEIIDCFQNAKAEGRALGRWDLLKDDFSPPVSAGLSCLAALPSEVKHLVPEPYSWIQNEIVEEFYAQSMSEEDNVFDMKKFEALCEREMERIRDEEGKDITQSNPKVSAEPFTGRRILSGDHWWTVLSRSPEPLIHPFDPPMPPNENLANLIPNPRIRVSRSFSINMPRARSVWGDKVKARKHHRNEGDDLKHLSFENLIHKGKVDILSIPYKTNYGKETRQITNEYNQRSPSDPSDDSSSMPEYIDVNERLELFNKTMPPSEPMVNVEGQTALHFLTELCNLEIIGTPEFQITTPSKSEYAAWKPQSYENYCLRIQPSKNKASNVLNRTILLDQDRDIGGQSRQSVKQHLASFAMAEIMGPDLNWTNLTFADMRWVLRGRQSNAVDGSKQQAAVAPKRKISKTLKIRKNTNIPFKNFEGQSASEMLKQLVDAGLLGGMEFSENRTSKGETRNEATMLVVYPAPGSSSSIISEKQLLQEKRRHGEAKKIVRQRMSSRVISELCGPDLDWQQATFEDLRSFLATKARAPGTTKTVISSRESKTAAASTRPTTTAPKDEISKTTKFRKNANIPFKNDEGQSALETLKQLADVGLLGAMEFSEKEPPEGGTGNEATILVIHPGPKASSSLIGQKQTLQERRRIGEAKKIVRQRLASRAISELCGPDLDWQQTTFEDLRFFLATKVAASRRTNKAS